MINRKYLYPDYYVYVHRKASDGKVFYVGKGTAGRAWQRGYKRNEHWNRIVEKHGFTVELVETGYENWYAQEREIELIAFYGIENLCNMTEGGENGGAGRKWSDESRAKLSASKKGKPNPGISGDKSHMKTAESRAKMSALRTGTKAPWMLGEKNHMHRPDQKALLSARCKGKKRPDITGANHKGAKKVLCVETGVVFDCLQDAAKWLRANGRSSATQSNISSVCTGNLKTAYGYHWKHA